MIMIMIYRRNFGNVMVISTCTANRAANCLRLSAKSENTIGLFETVSSSGSNVRPGVCTGPRRPFVYRVTVRILYANRYTATFTGNRAAQIVFGRQCTEPGLHTPRHRILLFARDLLLLGPSYNVIILRPCNIIYNIMDPYIIILTDVYYKLPCAVTAGINNAKRIPGESFPDSERETLPVIIL